MKPRHLRNELLGEHIYIIELGKHLKRTRIIKRLFQMLNIYMGLRGAKLMRRNLLLDTSHKKTVPLPPQTMRAEDCRTKYNQSSNKRGNHSEAGK